MTFFIFLFESCYRSLSRRCFAGAGFHFVQSKYGKCKFCTYHKTRRNKRKNTGSKGFESSITQIKQIFSRKELYPTIEEKAATLLYLIEKNHSFIDWNKRIDEVNLCSLCDISNEKLNNHASYFDGWIKLLKADKNIILKAISEAKIAAKYITQGSDGFSKGKNP